MDKQPKKKKLFQQVRQWDELAVPYCLYCLKELTGKQKYNKQKFCSYEHRSKYQIIHNKVEKKIHHNINERGEGFGTCETEGCDNILTELQTKYCSVQCRIIDRNRNAESTKKVCAIENCDNLVPIRNEKYCSMECAALGKNLAAQANRDKYWIKVQCRNCGKEFEKTRAQADKFHNKFCTQLCYIEWQHSGEDTVGSRFMWETTRNPQHSKKGLIEHLDRDVRTYMIQLNENEDVVKWDFPYKTPILGPGIEYRPTVIIEYKDGHKEAVEITTHMEDISKRNSYRWQAIQFHITEIDPAITACRLVYKENLKK